MGGGGAMGAASGEDAQDAAQQGEGQSENSADHRGTSLVWLPDPWVPSVSASPQVDLKGRARRPNPPCWRLAEVDQRPQPDQARRVVRRLRRDRTGR